MNKALSFDDITLVPRYNDIPSRKNVDTSVQFGDLSLKIPILSANMNTVTGPKMAHEMHHLGGLGFLHRFCSIEDNIEMYKDSTHLSADTTTVSVGEAVVSLGVNEAMDRYLALHEVGAKYFCIDVAHGHSKEVGKLITDIKNYDSNVFIVAGNVCTSTGAEYLAEKGADAIKIGIGPGSVCSTRVQTGFGVPQFSAIRECRSTVSENMLLIADGGIRSPGDAVKAFVAGADAVMLGGMFAGCDETPGEIIIENRSYYTEDNTFVDIPIERYKIFRGMASKEAQEEFMGDMKDWKTSEGIEIRVAAKGPVSDVISNLMGGIRSGMTYAGSNNLKQIAQRTKWIEVSAAGTAEGRPHGKDRL